MPKQLLNSKPTFKNPRKRGFFTLELVKMILSEGQIRHKILILEVIYIFRPKSTLEKGAFKTKNNAQTTAIHLQTNFQKPLKTGFLTLKMVRITLSEGQILSKFFFQRGRTSTFRPDNTTESGRPKIMPKQSLNNSKPHFKKSKKTLFRAQKRSNYGYQFWQKCRFLVVFWT